MNFKNTIKWGKTKKNEIDKIPQTFGEYIKHAQTANPEIKTLESWRRNREKFISSNNISKIDSAQSPTLKLSKYRWMKAGKSRKISLDQPFENQKKYK